MKTIILSCFLIVIISLSGCLGCGGSMPFVENEQAESEDEKIRRIAYDVFKQMELERQQLETIKHKSMDQAQPIPSPVMQKLAAMMPTKKEFGVESVDKSNRVIVFDADSSVVAKLNIGQFGHVRQLSIVEGLNRWQLKVSARYDFDEVVNYLNNLQ
jgi:hypothetical protein